MEREQNRGRTDGKNGPAGDDGEDGPAGDDGEDETVRVWLAERSYSDDEQNIIILIYATTDGRRYLRKERALTSFGDNRPTTAAVDASPKNLGTVNDPETREQYAAHATRLAQAHDPDDHV